MPAPTRPQIEANYNLPKFKVEVFTPASVWVELTNALITSISGSVDSTTSVNAMSFGSPSEPRATLEIEDYAPYLIYKLSSPIWINRQIRISFGFDTSDYVPAFYGIIKTISKSNEMVQLTLGGVEEFIRKIKLTSPIYFRKPAATKTTIASIEDPANFSYAAGAINYALWNAGGRPYEQKDINYFEVEADWRFWYSLEQSIITPEYIWFSGDNTLDELYTLARATGGQLYQGVNGVYHYSQPLSFGDVSGYGGVYFTFTDDFFDGYEENIAATELVGTVKLTFSQRFIQPDEIIIEDKVRRLFTPSESNVIELSPSAPIWSYNGIIPYDPVTAQNTIKAVLLTNEAVTPTIGAVVYDSTKISLGIINPSATTSMLIHSITITGRTLKVGEDMTVSYGSELPVVIIENNPYIQNKDHATRLARMIFDFYNDPKPIITLNNVIYDPDRFVGELVKLNSMFRNDGAVYRIIKLSHENIGTSMSVSLVDVSNLPTRANMFIIGTAYSAGDTRQLSY